MRFGNTEAAEIDYTKLIDSDVETAAVALRRLYHIASLEQDFVRKEWVVQHAEERLRTYPEALQDFWVRIGIESYRRGEYDLSEYFLSKVWNLKVTDSIPEAVPLYLAQLYMRKDRKEDARHRVNRRHVAGGHTNESQTTNKIFNTVTERRESLIDDPLARQLAQDMGDTSNLAYYRRAVREVPAPILLRARGEVLEERNIKRSRGAMFAYLVKKHVTFARQSRGLAA